MAEPGQVTFSRLDQLDGGRHASYLYSMTDGSRQASVRIVRCRRKTLGLQVEKNRTTELRVPVNCPWGEIYGFLGSRFDWILSAEEELAQWQTGPVDAFEQGGEISYLGKRYRLDIRQSRHRFVQLDGDKLLVWVRNPANGAGVEDQIRNWLRRQAEDLFTRRILMINPLFDDDIVPGDLTIRKMKARWGSCSSNGDICLSLMLVREALSQIDFVIAHELCHLRHFAHNMTFYALMDRVMPDWRDREKVLTGAVPGSSF